MLSSAIASKVHSYSASQPRIRPVGRIWPNGEFSLGYCRDGQERAREEELSAYRGGRFMTQAEAEAKLEAMEELLGEMGRFYSMSADLSASGLNLSHVWNSHKASPRAKNGLKGLTQFGTKMLRSACYLLEERLGKEDCVMVTLTVPTLNRQQRVKLARAWGQLTNRLVQYLTRELVRQGRKPVIAGCVEIQTGRLQKYRQGYLHLHLVCPAHSNKGGRWAIDASDLRTWWKLAIERIIGCQLTTLPRIETALVEKSVEGYLGKYLSKGQGEELAGFVGDLGEESVPGQWWFMSAPMRDAVKSATVAGANTGVILDCFVNHVLEMGTGEGLEYIRHVDCDFDGRKVTVGWVGRLTPDMARDLRAFLRS